MRLHRGTPEARGKYVFLDGKLVPGKEVHWADDESGEVEVIRRDENGRFMRADENGRLDASGGYVAVEIRRGKVEFRLSAAELGPSA